MYDASFLYRFVLQQREPRSKEQIGNIQLDIFELITKAGMGVYRRLDFVVLGRMI